MGRITSNGVRLWLDPVFLAAVSGALVAGEPTEPILDILRNASVTGLAAYTVEVHVEQDVCLTFPEQGTYTKHCTITRGAEGMALACETDYLPAPVYRPVGVGEYKPLDYDREGNLVIWMRERELALWTDDRNERFCMNKSFFVNPRGDIVLTGHARALNLYPCTEAWVPPAEMRQIWWALGQDVASAFQHVVGDTSPPDGLRLLSIRGLDDRGPREGTWDVAIDPAAGFLIRSASIKLDDVQSPPSREIKTIGLRRFGELALPEKGSLRINFGTSGRSLVKRVVLKDFSPVTDEEVFDRVRREMDRAALERDLTVYDYRSTLRIRPSCTTDTA